jgi:hypothetical protein
VASANAGSYSVLGEQQRRIGDERVGNADRHDRRERADDRNAARINVSGDRWHGEFLGECKWHGASELPMAEGWYGD